MAKVYENLKPVQTKKEARERGRRGGKASGEARRKKKSMREALQVIMSLDVQDKRARHKIKEMFGINDEDIDNQMLVLASTINQATKGNMQAITFIRDTLGEKPVEKMEVSSPINETINKIEEHISKRK
jgi:hypothetical protein